MMLLHPGFYNLQKYEEFVANEVLQRAQRKMARPLRKKDAAKGKESGLQPQFA